MSGSQNTAVHLADYTPPAYLVDEVHLTFQLHPTNTLVQSRIAFRPNPATEDRTFQLHGEGLSLRRASIDGQDWKPHINEGILTAKVPDAPFVWEAEVEINPEANTSLEGLYMSNGMYCTQCEAEGFRKITYYPDRPDVMAPFTVRIESGAPFRLSNGDLVAGDGPHPVLLSNGNPVASGEGWAEWHDPWPKPAYLFALVAGDLRATADRFTTLSGRDVALNIWVRPGDETKCAFAMDALKRSMAWDEETYGREYDLDVFNLVSVDDFNAGAMENKGLNIFNSKYVLASPETATDRDYANIEDIIAHEYFHNWTGNRITCRDWFQLCLKEGLTVFREQQFGGDQRGHAVKRIEDTLTLRATQFREDAGPLAHPVRPASYVAIDNFYTATVYEKGAEVIGMLKRLVGDDTYAAALNLYFERYDGTAATIEDWISVFEEVSGRDLAQFALWYSQAGTPRVTMADDFESGTYTLHLTQTIPPTPGQPDKEPMHFPVALGLLSDSGVEVLRTTVLEMRQATQSFAFDGFESKPKPSLLRGFSAPVILDQPMSASERAFFLTHDTDPFRKWEAGRHLARDGLMATLLKGAAPDQTYLEAMSAVVQDASLAPDFRALLLALPSEDDLAQAVVDAGQTPDPSQIHSALEALRDAMATHLEPQLAPLMDEMDTPGPYSPRDAAPRALRQACLRLLNRRDGGAAALSQFEAQRNMTEELSAFVCLQHTPHAADAAKQFYGRWQHERLVIDNWFSLQISSAEPDAALAVARELERHPDFEPANPNRLRALVGGFVSNTAAFHRPDGDGYRFLEGWIRHTDPLNPNVAARMVNAFSTWRRYDADRQGMVGEALARIAAVPKLSPDTREMVERILNG